MGASLMVMLVTRPEPDAAATLLRLQALGIAAVAAPLMVRQTLATALPAAGGFAAMAVTSPNALRALAERGALAQYQHLPVYAVGRKTADDALALGFAEAIDAGGTFGDVVNGLAHAGLAGPVFYPAGTHLSGDLARSVAPFGVSVETVRVYDMVAAPGEALLEVLAEGLPGAVLHYSRRSAELFVAALDGQLDRDARSAMAMLCISEKVAEPLIAAHFNRIALADHPNDDAMMTLALAFAREQNGP
ncbi:uroporphyrinogen-III synthase [Devosia limi]|nr:uroporphyrinogen-III synthase [Devosia limi]